MSELAGRVVSASAQHLHVPAEGHADPHQQPKVVLPHTSGPNQLRPGAPHVEYHHTPYEAADSDPPRQGLHDGSTFAMGACCVAGWCSGWAISCRWQRNAAAAVAHQHADCGVPTVAAAGP